MIRLALILGLLGLALATGLIVWSGYEQVLQALAVAGWGIVWTSLFHLVSMFCCIVGWQVLLGHGRPSKMYFMFVLWIRAAINNLMPVARIGGEIVSVRLLIQKGMRKSQAVACTIVETTLSIVAVFLVSVAGVACLALRFSDQQLESQLILGLVFTVPLIAALFAVQKLGIFSLLTRVFTLLFPDLWKKFAGNSAQLDHAIRTMYRRRGRVLACLLWEVAAWTVGAGEVWLALYFLGHPIGLMDAFMVEALIQAASSAAFLVPGALGVQEAAFMLFGTMLGLPTEIAAALAVIRRCRDLLLYVPALIVWQYREGRLLWHAHKTKKAPKAKVLP